MKGAFALVVAMLPFPAAAGPVRSAQAEDFFPAAAPERVPASIVLRVAQPAEGHWIVRTPEGRTACRVPCDFTFDQRAGWAVYAVESAGPGEIEKTVDRIDFPDRIDYGPGTTVAAKVNPAKPSMVGPAVLMATSLAVAVIGATKINCESQDGLKDPAACFGGIAAASVGGLGFLSGLIWLTVRVATPRLTLVPESGTGASGPPVSGRFRLAWTGSAAVVAMRF